MFQSCIVYRRGPAGVRARGFVLMEQVERQPCMQSEQKGDNRGLKLGAIRTVGGGASFALT